MSRGTRSPLTSVPRKDDDRATMVPVGSGSRPFDFDSHVGAHRAQHVQQARPRGVEPDVPYGDLRVAVHHGRHDPKGGG